LNGKGENKNPEGVTLLLWSEISVEYSIEKVTEPRRGDIIIESEKKKCKNAKGVTSI